jgi:hypothetical protein
VTDLAPDLHEHQGALLGTLAFRHDDDETAEWKTLNELLVDFYRWREDDPIEVDAAGEIERAVLVLEDAATRGLLEKYELASVRDTPMRISRAGESALMEWNVASTDDYSEASVEDVLTDGQVSHYDSAAWTGITQKLIDARNAKLVSSLIDKALLSLPISEAGNFKIMQAAAYLKAAKELTDAPEPPSELIWQIIGRAADLVGLLGLFAMLFQAFN